MTTKQRAFLRGLAMGITPVTQIGKEGLSVSFYNGIDDVLEKRELVKISVLQTSPIPVREAAEHLASTLSCEIVQVIGSRIVLYRKSQQKPKIELPR